jgi:tetratricopeptide (TPR) repeat protein
VIESPAPSTEQSAKPKPSPNAKRQRPSPTSASSAGTAKNQAKSHYDRAVENVKRGDWQGALTELDEAIRIDPRYADALLSRGMVYDLGLQQYDKAIVDLTEAIRLQPGSAIAILARRARCTAYMALNRYNDAIADTNELLKIKTERQWPYSIQAMCYSYLRNSAAAEEATKKARELDAK